MASCLPKSRGGVPEQSWRLFFNGVELANWIAFEADEGWILCHVHDAKGRLMEGETKMLTGVVVAIPRGPDTIAPPVLALVP